MGLRLKGQEIKVGLTSPTGSVSGIEHVKSLEAELDIQILEEGYLGSTANEFDEIYNGVSGDMEIHMSSPKYFEFVQQVQDRAERRDAAGGTFTATAAFNFPNGQRARLTFEDIHFGPLPIKMTERSAYVSANLTWKCARLRRVL